MSKKKSAIIDDDPLAWLKNEDITNEITAIETSAETSEISTQSGNVATESHVENNTDEDNIEQSFIKGKTVEADSNEETLLAETEIEIETEIEADIQTDTNIETERQDINSEALQTSGSEKYTSAFSENNEEDVAMATSNNEKIVLEEDVSIVQAAVLKEAWLPVLDSGKNINIDASAVEDIDTAGLQLLLSLVKTAKETGRSVTWESPSETVINAVKETSLKDALGIQL